MTLTFMPPIIAHRGASAYAPENTMAAFVKAAQLGMQWVEFDVVLANCGTPILFHDETLDRTANGVGEIDAFSYAHLCTLDAGKWFHARYAGERIPSLHNVLLFLQEVGMSANVEIKPMPGKEEETVAKTLEVMEGISTKSGRGRGNGTQILFSSFSVSSLRYLRKYAPDCNMGLLLEKWEPDWEKLCDELNCISIHTDESIVTEASVQKVKDKHKYLLCYTVNDPIRAKALFEMGVDAVFSDCPDLIERELAYGGV